MANETMHPLLQQLYSLRQTVGRVTAENASKSRLIGEKERLLDQNLAPTNGGASLERNMKSVLPDYLQPGNVGDVNKVIWPFWFTAQTPELPAATGGTATQSVSTFTVTQEAAFILLEVTKAVFVHTTPAPGDDQFVLVDPNQPGAAAKTPGLSCIITDAQSRRQFMNSPLNFSHIGYDRFPWEFPAPMMFLPNSTIEVQLFNSNTANNYVPWLTFFGVRVRVEDAQEILSLVHG